MSDSSGTTPSSLSQLLSALIPNLVVFAVFLVAFLVIRKKQPRVYEPRASVETLPKELKTEATPSGPWQWLVYLIRRPHSWMVLKTGADGFFYLRYVVMFIILTFFGVCICWPILFPLNIANGAGNAQLDMLAMGNVKDTTRYIGHALVSWVFFGAVIYAIYHELVYYTTFRHALQTTPLYDSLISSRTLLLLDLPKRYLDETELRTLFPAASNVWYSRDYKKLTKKVEERTKLANKYEGTLNKVLTKATKMRAKALKKNQPAPAPEDDINAYLKDGKKRPTHRLKFLIGKKVDTLDYGAEKLGELNREIKQEQEQFGLASQTTSVFLEFPTQLDAQKAYQLIPYNKETKRCGRYIGLAPDDIIWTNLSSSWLVRSLKKVAASTVLTLTIIFWCIPVAVVGAISNINFLIEKLPWLDFLNNLPSQIMGVVTSLLPTVALAILMSLVPPFVKKMGKISGCVTIPEVEKYCQQWFYAFQVVNSFLTVTLASAAAGVVTDVINDPNSGVSLVSQKIPTASNFYIAYIILFGLSFSAAMLLQLVAVILAQFLGKLLDKTPKAKWNRYTTLGQPFFSVLYPNFQLLVLITVIYSIISPLILGFSAIAFLLIFSAFLYTFTYVLRPNATDARGRNYPLALFLTFCALYFAEVVLAIIIGLAKSWVALGFEIALVVVTIAVHLFFKWRFVPLFDTVPISAIKVAAGDPAFKYPASDFGLKEIKNEGKSFWEGGNQLDVSDQAQVLPERNVLDTYTGVESGSEKGSEKVSVPAASDFEEGKSTAVSATSPVAKASPTSTEKGPGFFKRMFNPHSQTFEFLRSQMPAEFFSYIEYNDDFVRTAYTDPAVRADEPHIWVSKDSMGLAEIEKAKALENGVDFSTDNAGFDEKGSVEFHGPPPSYEEAIKY